MAITASFTVNQTVGAPSVINLIDTSTGSDGTAVARRIYIANSANTYLVPSGTTTDYILFPLADGSSISMDVLNVDSAVNITLQYVNVSGSVVATVTSLEGFTLFNETFYYGLTQSQASQSSPPPIIQDTNYFSNKMQLRVLIDSGNQAISLGADIQSAQNCYNMATAMVAAQNDNF